jgi:hypothetical protein
MAGAEQARSELGSKAEHGLDAIVGRASMRLVEWSDQARALRGVDPRSFYAERFWLPILGPSTMWLLRYFAWELERSPDGAELDLSDVARGVGLGDRVGRNAPFLRTIGRAIDFAMIRVESCDAIASRRRLPLLSARQISRLPGPLQNSHERWTRETLSSRPTFRTSTVRPSFADTTRR